MTREQAINYLKSSGMSKEQIETVINALTCEDCISREALMKLFKEYQPSLATRVCEFGDALKELSSVKPQRAKGHLISNQQDGEVKAFWERYRCSVCGEYAQDNFNYCSRCGAELEGEEE